MILYTESGLIQQSYRCLSQAAESTCRKNKFKIFGSLSEFVEESEGYSNLVLENFQYIFLYHLLACSLVFAAFCLHHSFNFIGKIVATLLDLIFASSYKLKSLFTTLI